MSHGISRVNRRGALPPSFRIIVDGWRAATGASTLDECTQQLAALLGRVLPEGGLTVWHISRELLVAETAAAAGVGGGSRPAPQRVAIAPALLEEMRRMSRRARAFIAHRSPPNEIAALFAPAGEWESLVVAFLSTGEQLRGAISVAARDREAFTEAHTALLDELSAPVAAALALHEERQESRRLRDALEADRRALLERLARDEVSEAIIGADSGLRDVMLRVEQVAPTDAPVLLLGETGVGKEVVARAIHVRSRRARGPIVRVNCGAIPPGLIDSELFGHEKGSFTGAIATRRGWFERADGGTLFLDEVGELPLDAQVRLLRILQDGTFERVGGEKAERVDVRVVAATNRRLYDLIAKRAFREDLWYRLSVFPIELPALRDRPEDIPALATHFAARAAHRLGGTALAISPADIDLLVAYSWPGNARELAAVIERAAILGDGKRLCLAAALGPAAAPQRPTKSDDPLEDDAVILPLEQAMARHIARALRATRGRIEGPSGAAALLRINPHTLRARMRKLSLDWAQYRARSTPGAEES